MVAINHTHTKSAWRTFTVPGGLGLAVTFARTSGAPIHGLFNSPPPLWACLIPNGPLERRLQGQLDRNHGSRPVECSVIFP